MHYSTFKIIFKDQFEADQAQAVNAVIAAKDASFVSAIKNQVKNLGLDAKKIMDSMGIPAADQARYAAML